MEKKMDMNLVALYEIKRQSFLLGYIQNPQQFDDALAYAYYNRVAPYFHEFSKTELYGGDPFEDIYFVKRDFLDEVYEYLDDCILEDNFEALQFYKLESKFGGGPTNRIELIHAFEYARIHQRFSDECWNAIESNAPTEAVNLEKTFSPNHIYFV